MTEKNSIHVEELMSLAEAADYFPELSKESLRRYAWSGRLKSFKIGRNYVTTKKWVQEYLDTRHQGRRTDLHNNS
jgi:hypothetical protein